MRRKIAALAATMLVASGLTAATAVPAGAVVVCNYSVNSLADAQARDYAWVMINEGGEGCAVANVRHFSMPPANGRGYWTSTTRSSWYAQSPTARELQSRDWWFD